VLRARPIWQTLYALQAFREMVIGILAWVP
jgi:hypothetical protein